MTRQARWRLSFIAAGAAVVVAADQLTKWLVAGHSESLSRQPITVIPGFFNIVYAENTGVAFGLMQGMGNLLLIPAALGVLVVTYLIYLEIKARGWTWWLTLAPALILGGAVGNKIDRILWGYVIDFIDWHWGTWHWYTFNVADAAICVGVGLLICFSLVPAKPREEEQNANAPTTSPSINDDLANR